MRERQRRWLEHGFVEFEKLVLLRLIYVILDFLGQELDAVLERIWRLAFSLSSQVATVDRHEWYAVVVGVLLMLLDAAYFSGTRILVGVDHGYFL